MADVVATWTGAADTRAQQTSDHTTRGVPGYGAFATGDGGYVALGVLTEDKFWAGLCRGLGLDDLAELDFATRLARTDELQGRVGGAIATRARDDLVRDLGALDVPVAPVLRRQEMAELPHFRGRDVVVPEAWSHAVTGAPVRIAGSTRVGRTRPPQPDEHRGATWLT